jgi:hypothetical protein
MSLLDRWAARRKRTLATSATSATSARTPSVSAENHVASRCYTVATSPEAAADQPRAMRDVATRSNQPATPKTAVSCGVRRSCSGVADVADPLFHGIVPANDRNGPNDVVADLKAIFGNDDEAAAAAEQRLAKVRATDSPVGDDLPAWQAWMRPRYAYRLRRGYSRAEAWRIVWGDAEVEWHKRHGARPDPDRCAGCGERLMPGEGRRLPDGAVVHGGDPEKVECLAVYGAQWRGAASVALMAMGLTRPWQ